MAFSLPANVDIKRVLKIGGLALIALILISLAVTLASSTYKTVARKGGMSITQSGGEYMYGVGDMGMEESAVVYDNANGMAPGMPSLSVRNIAPIPPIESEGSTGSDAEAYEVTQYNGTIETRDKDEACGTLFGLKAEDYVIFEQANTYDRGCNATFKVARGRVEEVVALVKSLDPKEFIENTHTIKNQVEDFTSEIDILKKKQESIEDTLAKATVAYNEITQLARETGNADSLAKVINSKIGILERLTQERISVSTQLDRLARAKAEQLDRLDYTYFYLTVVENKYLDGENIKDSWKAAIKQFVRDVNKIAQDVSVNLITLLLLILQYLLYAFIILVVGKYAWHMAKRVWKGPQPPQV